MADVLDLSKSWYCVSKAQMLYYVYINVVVNIAFAILCKPSEEVREIKALWNLIFQLKSSSCCFVSAVCLLEQHRHRKDIGESAGVHHQSVQLH